MPKTETAALLEPFPVLGSLAVDALIRLRWMAVLGQLVSVLVAWQEFNVAIHWPPVLLIIALTAVTNFLLIALRRAGWWLGVGAIPHVMVWDTLLLAALLYWTGGAINPFALFLLLNAVMAALMLGRTASWVLMLVGFGSLLFLARHHHPLLGRDGNSLPPEVWLYGRITAFFLISSTLIYLVQKLRGNLREEMLQRKKAQDRLEEERRFHSIATLAAGAAHEMGTPLATIAVASRELELELAKDDPDDDLTRMARTIHSQVERCQKILSRLRPDPAQTPVQTFNLAQLAQRLKEPLSPADAARLLIKWNNTVELKLPLDAVTEALSNLLRNALQASSEDKAVELSASLKDAFVHFQIRDHGHGLAPEVREHLGEPFVTTKEPGHGMGLGLHLVKLLAHQLGGTLTARSASNGGEVFELTLPLEHHE